MADDSGSREVVVPTRLYKAVTVFSTLIAVVSVLLGFVALDVATDRAHAAPSEVNAAGALLGLVLIVVGGAVYAYAGRFRAAGMGNSKDDSNGDV